MREHVALTFLARRVGRLCGSGAAEHGDTLGLTTHPGLEAIPLGEDRFAWRRFEAAGGPTFAYCLEALQTATCELTAFEAPGACRLALV